MNDPMVAVSCTACDGERGEDTTTVLSLSGMGSLTALRWHVRRFGEAGVRWGEKHGCEAMTVRAVEGVTDAMLGEDFNRAVALAWAYEALSEEQWGAYCAWAVSPYGVTDAGAFTDQFYGAFASMTQFVVLTADDDVVGEILHRAGIEIGVDDDREPEVEALVDEGLFDDAFYTLPTADNGVYVFERQ